MRARSKTSSLGSYSQEVRQAGRVLASMEEADRAVLRGTEYDEEDLERANREGLECVEIDGVPIIREIEAGMERAKLYGEEPSSPSHQTTLSAPSEKTVRGGPAGSVIRRARRDTRPSITGIDRARDEVRRLPIQTAPMDRRRSQDWAKSSRAAPLPRTDLALIADAQEKEDEAAEDWAPPLRLEPFHSAARCWMAPSEPGQTQRPARAIRRKEGGRPATHAQVKTEALPSTSERAIASHTALPLGAPISLKREREEDATSRSSQRNAEPPATRIKLEKQIPYIDLTASDAESETDTQPTSPLKELRPSIYTELGTSPSIMAGLCLCNY